MDFNSLAAGAPFYILQKADKPTLRIASVKSKSEPKPAYPTHTPGIMQSPSLIIDMVVSVDSMIQTSKKALEQVEYHRAVTEVGEKMIEDLNPSYAEGKQQARTIKALQERVQEQDRKLDDILTILQKLDAPAPKKTNP